MTSKPPLPKRRFAIIWRLVVNGQINDREQIIWARTWTHASLAAQVELNQLAAKDPWFIYGVIDLEPPMADEGGVQDQQVA